MLPVIDSTNQYLLDRIGELNRAMPVLQNTSRLAVVAGGEMVFAFWRKLIFVDVLASGKGPAAAIGLSLVIGIVMAEVYASWEQIKFVSNGLMTSICRSQAGRHSCGADWQNWRCGAIVIGAGINMAMRRVEESVVNRGGSRCRKRGSISIVIRWRPANT